MNHFKKCNRFCLLGWVIVVAGATAVMAQSTEPATEAAAPSTQPTTMVLESTTEPTMAIAPATEPTTMADAPTTQPTTLAIATTTRPSTIPSSTSSRRYSYYRPTTPTAPVTPAHPTGPRIEPLPMSADFQVLSRRNIFIKGRQFTESDENVRPSRDNFPPGPTEDELIFNGVTITDESAAAFIEDTTSQTVKIVQVGEAIAKGKIIAITLDSLDYQADGKTYRVMVGQNLFGGDPVGVASTQPTSQPAPGSTDDILERLKRRRLEELGR